MILPAGNQYNMKSLPNSPQGGFSKGRLFFQLSWKELFSWWAILAGLVVLFVLYGFEIKYYKMLFEPGSLLETSALFGALIGGSAAFLYARNVPDYTDRLAVFVFIFGSILFFAPLFGSLLNRWGSLTKPERKKYEIFEVQKVDNFSTNYDVFIFENDNLEKIELKNILTVPKKGDRIELILHRGAFGYDWVSQD